jgi:hypothetical protein
MQIMTKNKSIVKIVITHKDGTVSNVAPGSGHSIIISLDCGGSIAQVVSGKLPELCGLLDSIHTKNPEILARLTAAQSGKQVTRFDRITDEAFLDLPVGGTA